MATLISALAQLALVNCVMIIVILFCRAPVTRLAGARWAYAMWATLLLPLVFLVLPGSVFSSLMPSLFQQISQQISVPNNLSWLERLSFSDTFMAVLLAAWAGGVVVSFWRTVRRNGKLKITIRPFLDELSGDQAQMVDRVCRRSGVFPFPQVQFSTHVDSPALYGVVKPVLLLPAQFFEEFNPSEQELMIFHELVHYQRNDAWSNLFFRVLRCVFWFNPLVALAESRFRLDQELSCDQSVLCDESRSNKIHYARALLKAASPGYSDKLVGFRNSSPEIVSRIKLLQHHKVVPVQSVFGTGSIALLLILATFLSVPFVDEGSTFSAMSSWCSVYQNLSL